MGENDLVKTENVIDKKNESKKISKQIKPRAIVCDLDDSIVAFLKTLCKIHNDKHGTCLTDNNITTWNFDGLDITDARGNRVTGADLQQTYKYFEDNGLYAVLPTLDYAKYALDTAHAIGYRVILLTARPEKYRIQTELNLIIEDLYYDDIFFEWDKVKKIKELSKNYKIDMFVDDKFETAKAVAENCKVKNVFLIDKGHNKTANVEEFEIIRANDLMDCIKELKHINKPIKE